MDDLGPGFVLTTACITAGITLIFFLKANHTERLAKIERGLQYEENDRRYRSFIEVKVGMLMMGLGSGLLLALGTEKMTNMAEPSIIYPALMFVCGGLSLLASYFLVDKLQHKD
jgi:hypothetical protein